MEDDDDFDGVYDEDNADCDCSDYDTDLMLGAAWCHKCGRNWGLTAEEVKREIEFQAEYMAQFEQQRMSENEPIELSGVAEQLAEGAGAWRSCSGCHELNEGHPTGAWSSVLKSHLGLGCRECGGIGAVWDNTDYSKLGEFMSRTPLNPDWATCPTRGLFLRQSLRDQIKHLRDRESMSRKAYRQPFMSEPCNYLADIYAEAAAIFEERFRDLSTPIPHPPAE